MILIWSNTGEWGGVDVLIMRLAEHLRSRGMPFAIAEPERSRLRADLPFAKFIGIGEAATLSDMVDVVLMPSVAKLRDPSFPWAAFESARIFCWDVQPNSPLINFVPLADRLLNLFGYSAVRPLLRLLRGHARLVRSVFSRLSSGGSLGVMDDATRRALHFFYPDIDRDSAPTIPIPAPLGKVLKPRLHNVGGEQPLTLGYLGRVDPFKWSALGPFIAHSLSSLARSRRVKLLAVSEGAEVDRVRDACVRARVEFEPHGYMSNENARAFIGENSHLAVAMGTAALDIAAVGHPCVVIDPAASRFSGPQQLFRFIHEAEGYSLGEFRDFPGYVAGLRTFEQCIAMAEDRDLGPPARDYVARCHDPETCFDRLLDSIGQSRTKVAEIAPIVVAIERSIVQKNRYYGWPGRLLR